MRGRHLVDQLHLHRVRERGLAAEGKGIVLQSRGASFSLDLDHPNRFEPGKLPFHTLIPAVAWFGPDDWTAFGVMGGYMQLQGHLQVLTVLLDHNASLQENTRPPAVAVPVRREPRR